MSYESGSAGSVSADDRLHRITKTFTHRDSREPSPPPTVREGSTLYQKASAYHWLASSMVTQFQPIDLPAAAPSSRSASQSSLISKGDEGYDEAVQDAARRIHLYIPSGLADCAEELDAELMNNQDLLGSSSASPYIGNPHYLRKKLLSLNASFGWRAKYDSSPDGGWYYINLVDRSVKGWHMDDISRDPPLDDGAGPTWLEVNQQAAKRVEYAGNIRIPREVVTALEMLRRGTLKAPYSQHRTLRREIKDSVKREKQQWLTSMLDHYTPADHTNDSRTLSEVSPVRKASHSYDVSPPDKYADGSAVHLTGAAAGQSLYAAKNSQSIHQDRYDIDKDVPFGKLQSSWLNGSSGYISLFDADREASGRSTSSRRHEPLSSAMRRDSLSRRTQMGIDLILSDEANNRNKIEHEFTLLYLLIVKPLWRRDGLEQQERFGRERLLVWEMAEATKIFLLSMPSTAAVQPIGSGYTSARSYTTSTTSLLTFILSPPSATAVAALRRPQSQQRVDITPSIELRPISNQSSASSAASYGGEYPLRQSKSMSYNGGASISPSPRRHYYNELYDSAGSSPMVALTETVFRSAFFLFVYQADQIKNEEVSERQEIIQYALSSIEGTFGAQTTDKGTLVRRGTESVARSQIALEEANTRGIIERQYHSIGEKLRFHQYQNNKLWSSLRQALVDEESSARLELMRSEDIVRSTILRRYGAAGDAYAEERVKGIELWSRRLNDIGSPSYRYEGYRGSPSPLRGKSVDPYAYISPTKEIFKSPSSKPVRRGGNPADETVIISPLTVTSPSQPRYMASSPEYITPVPSLVTTNGSGGGDVLDLVEGQKQLFAHYIDVKEKFIAGAYVEMVGPTKALEEGSHQRPPRTTQDSILSRQATSAPSAALAINSPPSAGANYSIIDAAYEQLKLRQLQAAETKRILAVTEHKGRKAEWKEFSKMAHVARGGDEERGETSNNASFVRGEEAHLVQSLPTSRHATPSKSSSLHQPKKFIEAAAHTSTAQRLLEGNSRYSRLSAEIRKEATTFQNVDILVPPHATDDGSYFSRTYTEELEYLRSQRHQRATKVYASRMERMLWGDQNNSHHIHKSSSTLSNTSFLRPHRLISVLEAEERKAEEMQTISRFKDLKRKEAAESMAFESPARNSPIEPENKSPRPTEPSSNALPRKRTQILKVPTLPTNVILSPKRIKTKTTSTQSEPMAQPVLQASTKAPSELPKPKSTVSAAIQTELFLPSPPLTNVAQVVSTSRSLSINDYRGESLSMSDVNEHHPATNYVRSPHFDESEGDDVRLGSYGEHYPHHHEPDPLMPPGNGMDLLHWDHEGIEAALDNGMDPVSLPVELTAGAVGIQKVSDTNGLSFGIGSAGVAGGLFIYEVLFKLVPTAARLRRVGIHGARHLRSRSNFVSSNANRSVSMGSVVSTGTSPSKSKGWSEIFAPSSSQFNTSSGMRGGSRHAEVEGTYLEGSGMGVALGFTSRDFHALHNTFAYLYTETGTLALAADDRSNGHAFGEDFLSLFAENFTKGKASGNIPEKVEVRVTAVLDLDRRELSFIVNGKQQGVAYQFEETDPEDIEPLFPLVLLGEIGDEAWLVKPSV